MAKHNIKDPKAIVCILLVSLCFCASIILFTMGGVFFTEEHPKVLHYADDICQVDSESYKVYQCRSRYQRYTCYGPIWNVHRGANRTIFTTVEQQRRYRSASEALDKAYEYQIGSSYSCWYDTRDPAVAQWDKPSTRIAIILLCCGGLSVLLTVLFLFLAIRLVQQEILQNKHNTIEPYSFSNPYGNSKTNIQI